MKAVVLALLVLGSLALSPLSAGPLDRVVQKFLVDTGADLGSAARIYKASLRRVDGKVYREYFDALDSTFPSFPKKLECMPRLCWVTLVVPLKSLSL